MGDEHCNTDTDEGTIALLRKKSRRVSFAENTLVHIFDRDEESVTHPQSIPQPTDDPSELVSSDELGLGSGSDSKDSSQNEQDYEDLDELPSFFHPVQSPSSGSIIGSATSNDDFFGPVSTSFIKPGQLSSSSSSDENNDTTRDSTFFSMHFQSLAKSESGDLRTSTAFKLNFDEKTPTLDSAPTTAGSSMVLTIAKRPNVLSSTLAAKSSMGNDSNDMSLVGVSPKKYDFGVLSPALDAGLDNTVRAPKSPINMGRNLMDLIQDRDVDNIRNSHSTPKEGVSIHNSPFAFNFSDVTHNSSASIQKSISRLSMLQASPFYSTPDAKFGSLPVKSLDSIFENIPPESLMDQNSTESRTSEDREVSPDNFQDQAGNQNSPIQIDKIDFATMEIGSLPDPEIKKFKDLSEHEKEDEGEINPSALLDKYELNQYSPNQNLEDSRMIDSSPNSSLLRNRLRSTSAKKRENEEAKVGDRSQRENSIEIQKSPKRFKGYVRDSEYLERQNEMKHWTDIYSKIKEDTEKMISWSNDNLTLHEIDLFEDMLVCTHRSRTYEILQTQLQSKKMFDPNSTIQQKRAAETHLELQKVVHEHLKLKLTRAKREQLLKKVELLESDIQERKLLKSKVLPEMPITIEVISSKQPVDDTHEVGHIKTALHQSRDISEGKITNLTNFFNIACKLKGDPGCENTMQSVNDHLVKRMQGLFIHQDSQLWALDSLEDRNGHRNIALNYLGFNTQRLYISEGPDSRLSSSNMLNQTKINKIFPDMGICTALSFVLCGEATQKYNGPRSLMQETQTSNLLLGNLLDVAEEVHQVQIELRNLTQTCFKLQSADQLDLQLCFLDFEKGRKVILTLDMSCLKRGIYPSDIVPCFSAVGSRSSESEKLIAEFRRAIHEVEAGFCRIIRICRCFSQIAQVSPR